VRRPRVDRGGPAAVSERRRSKRARKERSRAKASVSAFNSPLLPPLPPPPYLALVATCGQKVRGGSRPVGPGGTALGRHASNARAARQARRCGGSAHGAAPAGAVAGRCARQGRNGARRLWGRRRRRRGGAQRRDLRARRGALATRRGHARGPLRRRLRSARRAAVPCWGPNRRGLCSARGCARLRREQRHVAHGGERQQWGHAAADFARATLAPGHAPVSGVAPVCGGAAATERRRPE